MHYGIHSSKRERQEEGICIEKPLLSEGSLVAQPQKVLWVVKDIAWPRLSPIWTHWIQTHAGHTVIATGREEGSQRPKLKQQKYRKAKGEPPS